MNFERFFSPVYASLKNKPQDWRRDSDCIMKHIPSGEKYWIANGPLGFSGHKSYDYEHYGRRVGLIERFFCWPYVKRILSMCAESVYNTDE